jgi:arylsulfatase A-like enzyme
MSFKSNHFVFLFIVLNFSIQSIAVSQQERAKNILVLYSDDQSYNTLGCMGNKIIKTPHLDQLASEGMLFTQAHVMGGHHGAVCIPSRIMMLTGRYVNRLPGDGGTLPDSIVSIPEILRSRGYTTYHTGKWHSDKASHHRIFSDGGDIFFGGMHFEKDGGQFHPTVYPFDPTGNYPTSSLRNADTFSTSLYANNAIRFLNSEKAREKPFYCYVAFTSPHDPRTPPDHYAKMYDPEKIPLPPNFLSRYPFDNGALLVRDEQLLAVPRKEDEIRKEIALYYGMISDLDAQVGRILEALEKNGLRKSTLIVFAGDNGLAVGQHGLLGKQNLYEHSIRVPMIVAGPGVPKSSVYRGFNYLSDITPTLYEYLGVKPPASVEAKSLYPVFQHPEQVIRKSIYNVFGHWSRSIKTADGFKLIVYNVDGVGHMELFNLKKDPWEKTDLSSSAAYGKKITVMRSELKKQMAAAHDDLDIDQPNFGRKPGQKGRGN